MAPRRGEITEDRREGEAAEWGERISSAETKISSMEVKISNIDAKISDIDTKLSRMEDVLEENARGVTKAIQQLMEERGDSRNQLGKGKEVSPNPNPEKSPKEDGNRVGNDGGTSGQGGRPHEGDPRPAAPWMDLGQGTTGQLRPTLGWAGSTIRGGPGGAYTGQHSRPARGPPQPATPWMGLGQEELGHQGGAGRSQADRMGVGQVDLAVEYGLYELAEEGGPPDDRWREPERPYYGGARDGGRRAGQNRGAYHHGPWRERRPAEGVERRLRKLKLPLFEGDDAYG